MSADPTLDTIGVYERGLNAYLNHWTRRRYRVPRLLEELLEKTPQRAWVLDLGCGPALDMMYLTARGYRAVGIDAAWNFLASARKRSRRLRLIQADMRRLPLGVARFEAIWAAAALIHLPKPGVGPVLTDLRDLVKPEGRLGATFLHGTTSGVLTQGWLPGRYFSRWTKSELARVVTRAGWEIETLTTVVNRERRGRWLNLIARRTSI